MTPVLTVLLDTFFPMFLAWTLRMGLGGGSGSSSWSCRLLWVAPIVRSLAVRIWILASIRRFPRVVSLDMCVLYQKWVDK